jgi:ABC-type glycerol-3-phosphate transport system permease component
VAATRHDTNRWADFWQRRSMQDRVWRTIVYAVLIGVSIIMIFPLYWLVTSALKPENQIFVFPPRWFPAEITLQNFRQAVTGEVLTSSADIVSGSNFSFPLYVRNTLIIITGNMVFGVTISSLVAYGLARMKFVGRNLIFYSVIGAMFLPPIVLIIPRFVLFGQLGVLGTFWPLIIPGFFGYANQIFFLRQFYLAIPQDLEDAAYVDGCSPLRFWWSILLPLSKPAIIAQLIITFVYHWNDFLDPLIYLGQNSNLRTVQLAVVQFMDPRTIRYGVLMAYAALLVAPPLILFLVAQRAFIQGIVFTGVKE